MQAVPTYAHLELFAMRQRLSTRLSEFGIRAQLPKLELPKLAALSSLVERHVQKSDIFGRRWLKSVLLSLILLLEHCLENPAPKHELFLNEPRETSTHLESPVGNLVLLGLCAQVLWCCFRN